MPFGKPKLSRTKKVRCIECGETYPEAEIELKHAGRIEPHQASGPTQPGDYWNSKCPECGKMNCMQEEYVKMTNEEFREMQHEMARRIHEQRKNANNRP